MNICVISEELSEPFDEGMENFVYNVIRQFSKNNNVLALSTRGGNTDRRYIKGLNTNKTFLSYSLLKEIRHFNPEVVIYVPLPSATIFSFVRTRILKLYAKKAKTIMVALQPREYSFVAREIIPFLKPDLIFVQSPRMLKRLSDFGSRVECIPTGVDLGRFCPVGTKRKIELKKKYGMSLNKYVILHVGHINRNRNIQILKELQSEENQILIVGSTKTSQDRVLISELTAKGVNVIVNYLGNIEEVYQLSDCYVFPIISEMASIEIPLSVLEAMACNLPVITTKYGGLPSIFMEAEGLFYFKGFRDLACKIEQAKKMKFFATRKLVEPYSWEEITQEMLTHIT